MCVGTIVNSLCVTGLHLLLSATGVVIDLNLPYKLSDRIETVTAVATI